MNNTLVESLPNAIKSSYSINGVMKYGFCLYHDLENSMLHDAGFDSVITGRCFVLMIKALENDYYVENMKKIVHNIGNKVINQEKEIKIKHGWVDLKQIDSI